LSLREMHDHFAASGVQFIVLGYGVAAAHNSPVGRLSLDFPWADRRECLHPIAVELLGR
jgi:hypothetical protein